MTALVSIFCFPHELDELDRILTSVISDIGIQTDIGFWTFDITLCVSNEMVDWDRSSIPLSYFTRRFNRLRKLFAPLSINLSISESINGCVAHRRKCIQTYQNCDYFIWLDPDIVFEPGIFQSFEHAMKLATDKQGYCIITPEIVRIWDSTWDCLVNENFIEKPLNYQTTNNPFVDCGVKGKLTLEEVHNKSEGQPRFKFAGGWFTCIPGELLRLIGIPDLFSPYGLEDTFIMWVAEHLVRSGQLDIQQYKIKNLVVCENYKYRNYTHYTDHMTLIDQRGKFLAQTREVFNAEVQGAVNRILKKEEARPQ
jgi:hypothetical protein